MAISVSAISCELREIVLRDKAPEFLATSPKGTVPVLVDGADVIEESRDIMLWALEQYDPEGWLDIPTEDYVLIDQAEGEFKTALDRYKYASRYGSDAEVERGRGAQFLRTLDQRLSENAYLSGSKPKLTDYAIFPFVRQFANTDAHWFEGQDWDALKRWLKNFVESALFQSVMLKYPKWQSGDEATLFPG